MVELKNITVTFTNGRILVHAVKDASLTISDSEIFGIVGKSGAGKSTLLRTINLLQKTTTGNVVIDGKNVTRIEGKELRKLRLSIGMIFQHFNLINSKTVYQNIAFPLHIAGKKRNEIDCIVPRLLDIVGLTDKAQTYPAKLSGGQKQRVGIARALANNPKILLCDEPTSALDLETTNSILNLLGEINRKLGITIILITHEMAVVKKVCTKVAVMNNGLIIEIGDTYDIFSAPKNSFTRQLVENTFDIDIPERVFQNSPDKIVKIIYRGEKAEEPVLSDTIKHHKIQFNVIHGRIEYINNRPLGILVIRITGNSNEVQKSIIYLQSRVEMVEVLNG